MNFNTSRKSGRSTPRTAARHLRSRRGAIAALVAVTVPFMVLLACFALNVAYMEMVRQELKIACDSAAKAALVQVGATQQQATATSFAQTISNNNLVGGRTLNLASGSFQYGNATKNGSGIYAFTANGLPLNSVQVTGTASRSLFMTGLLPITTFNVNQTSVTTRISHDICLVLDRSASMAFDLSANEFQYPTDRTGALIQNYFTAPSPTLSRWAALTVAVNNFISTLQARNLDVHISLVTYSETFALGNYSCTEATTDVPLTSNYALIAPAMNNYGNNPLLGDTNISSGLALAQAQLTGGAARTTSDRTIILLTDGVATTGNTNIPPITLGYAQNNKIVTHAITFGAEAASGTAQAAMQGAATNGNGMFFNAPTAAQLTTAFQTIADSLPAVLIN
jgi:Ca-activated chloride channel family protein